MLKDVRFLGKYLYIFFAFSIVYFCASPCMGQEPLIGIEYEIAEVDTYNNIQSSSITPFSIVNSFIGWIRYPAEEKKWLYMSNATAYFRDVLAGGKTFISGPSDGDTWTADIIRPDGLKLTSAPITFYKSYNNQQNCFVSPYWALCNYNSLYVNWYTSAQCQPTGDWTMNFYNNGNRFYSGQFTLLPEINPDKLTAFNQGSYLDNYDSICKGPIDPKTGRPTSVPCSAQYPAPWTIKAKGCYLTSGVMILNYHGVSVDPPTLNTWLINYKDKNGKPIGYDLTGAIYPDAIADYGTAHRVNMSFLGGGGDRENLLCRYGPQMFGVKNDHHWVTATGRDSDKTTYKIIDPAGGVSTTLAAKYGNDMDGGIRAFGGPEYVYTDITGITIRFHSPGELLLVDPQGRKTGYNPISGIYYEEIPESSYESIGLEDAETGDPGDDTKELDIRQPAAGDYQVFVFGTDTGVYTLEIVARDPERNASKLEFLDLPITPGQTDTFGFYYPKTVGGEMSGSYNGTGQRPRDVNTFLAYASPTGHVTELPAGTTTYTMFIFYGDSIIPSTFKAELDGTDVSSLFHPVPEGYEAVTLSLSQGRNTLVLSVEANLNGRITRDTDRLVFVVP